MYCVSAMQFGGMSDGGTIQINQSVGKHRFMFTLNISIYFFGCLFIQEHKLICLQKVSNMRSNGKLAREIWCFVKDVCKCKVVTARNYTVKMWGFSF